MKNFKQQRYELGLECSALISDLHYFNNLDFYIELTKSFLDDKIDVKEFETKFCDMRNSDCGKSCRWEDMVYIIDNLKLKQFQDISNVIDKLFTDLDVFEADPLLREDYEIDEEELRNFAEEALSKMKSYYH